MPASQPSLFRRDDTFFGVCQGLAGDFGFNPLYLRILFAPLVLWNPAVAFGTYAVLGLLVALSRWIYPARSAVAREFVDRAVVAAACPVTAGQRLMGENDEGAVAVAA